MGGGCSPFNWPLFEAAVKPLWSNDAEEGQSCGTCPIGRPFQYWREGRNDGAPVARMAEY